MCRIVASLLCSNGHTTSIEYMGGCRALPSGDRLRWGEDARRVLSELMEVEESGLGASSLSVRLGGRASFISESEAGLASCRYEDAEDLSERKLDCPVRAALVKE